MPDSLTTADFQSRVLAIAPKVAVFDCDGTLWSGDAGSTFMRWTMGEMDVEALISPEQCRWMADRYAGYKRGQVSELAICGEMVQVYRGLRVADIRAAAARFFQQHVEPNIFPEMLTLVTALQATGTEIWAVSSTCDWVIEEGVRRFGIPPERVLSARVETTDGIATGNLLDVPTDEGKVASLRRVGVVDGMNAPEAVFGNSVHDAAMLAVARGREGISGSFAVNPSPDLLRRAASEGWPVYFPASVAPKEDTP